MLSPIRQGVSHLYFSGMASRLIVTALEIKVFDHLGSPFTAASLAEVLSLVFDRPEVVRMACQRIDEYGYADSFTVRGGNYLTDLIW